MKKLEIERKYLLKPCSPENFLQSIGLRYHRYVIAQYYTPPQEGKYVRYRQRDQEFFKTIKRGEGMVREEHESLVTREEFDDHLASHTGNIIKKDRFVFLYEGMTYEMDRFKKTLKGLCYLEIEFDDEEIARKFVLPEIFSGLYLSEVTEDKRFNNSSISKSSSIPSLISSKHLAKSRESIFLEPYESTTVALESIFATLTMRFDKESKRLLQNTNTPETLHQFRVSIRKLKSIMDIFKVFLLPSWYAKHRQNLSFLMTQTNANRDRDVLLEQMPFYQSLLPKKIQKGLIPLQKLLLKEKEISDKHLLTFAEDELLEYELTSLSKPGIKSYSSEESISQPIIITAMRIVKKQISNILKKGKRLDANSEDEEYHRLRIKYKKLRYFIEVTQSLIEPKKYEESIKSIKKMQTILGDFNDYQVQQSLLLSFGNEPALQGKKSKKAMAQLAIELEKLKEEKEDLFRKKFAEMLIDEERIKKLFEAY